jgi:hypothetical protein
MKPDGAQHAKAFVSGLFFAGAVTMLVSIFALGGPFAETMLFPVVDRVEFRPVLQDPDGALMLHVIGHKSRACDYADVSVLITRDDETTALGNVVFQPRTGSKNRPVGQQDFGIWTIVPYGRAVQFDIHHDCHPLWTTTTRLMWERKEPS